MLGAAAAGNVVSYTACEPGAATHAGLQSLSSLVNERLPGLQIEVLRRGAEDTPLPACTVDVVFTSPPYFNLELYSSCPATSERSPPPNSGTSPGLTVNFPAEPPWAPGTISML